MPNTLIGNLRLFWLKIVVVKRKMIRDLFKDLVFIIQLKLRVLLIQLKKGKNKLTQSQFSLKKNQ